MNKKEAFMELVQSEIFDKNENKESEIFSLALEYWNEFKGTTNKYPIVSDGGKKVLKIMQEQEDIMNNRFTAKRLAEDLFTNGRAIGAFMRKLVADGFVEMTSKNPAVYSLTEIGRKFQVEI